MKIAKFEYRGKIYWGEIKFSEVVLLKRTPFEKTLQPAKKIPLQEIKLLVPAQPSKIVCVGLNYRKHAKELNMPLPKSPIIFIKPVSSLINQGEVIRKPKSCKRLDYEAELALVIKKKAYKVSVENALTYVLGYCCLNDVTARDLQAQDGQWSRAKSFDTFCPCGPWLETKLNPDSLKIKTFLNGELKQDSSTKDFIFKTAKLVSFISSIMTLNPGDIISTGTPAGVGPMKKGDRVKVVIEGIGELVNRVS